MDSNNLREELWKLKMELEDAKEALQIKSAQADSRAAQIQRLRSEVCTKDLQLSEARRILDVTLKELQVDLDAVKTSRGISTQEIATPLTLQYSPASPRYTMTNTPQAPETITIVPSSILPLVPQELATESITDTHRGTAPVAHAVDYPSLGKRTVSQGQQKRGSGTEEFATHMAKRLKPSECIGLLTTLDHLRSERVATTTASARPSKIAVLKYDKDKFLMGRTCAGILKEGP
ncbi:MAG: hypothetical protein Q9208_006390 [Pyrenodesmia sp. 3 TL-2023]